MTVMPENRYEVKPCATDAARNNVAAFGVFRPPIPAPADRSRRPAALSAPTTST